MVALRIDKVVIKFNGVGRVSEYKQRMTFANLFKTPA